MALRPQTNQIDFLARRVIRVTPIYWVATAITVVYYLLRYPETPPSAEHIIKSFLFLPPPDGFGKPILYPGWTLNYEMFFYFTLSSFMIFKGRAISITCCALIVMGTAISSSKYGNNIYYANPILLEFVAGLLIGRVVKLGYHPSKKTGILLLCSSLIIFATHNHLKSDGIIAWGIPSALLVIGALAFEDSSLVKNKISQLLGEASYSIYVFHIIVIWAIDWSAPDSRSPILIAVATSASIVVGIVAHKTIERPMLKSMQGLLSIRKAPLDTAP